MSDKNEKYLEAEIEITELDATDVITTSAVIGDGKDDDPEGWTNPNDW
jgi:hypothetical protein